MIKMFMCCNFRTFTILMIDISKLLPKIILTPLITQTIHSILVNSILFILIHFNAKCHFTRIRILFLRYNDLIDCLISTIRFLYHDNKRAFSYWNTPYYIISACSPMVSSMMLLTDGTKPLPKQMVKYCLFDTFIWMTFCLNLTQFSINQKNPTTQ